MAFGMVWLLCVWTERFGIPKQQGDLRECMKLVLFLVNASGRGFCWSATAGV